MGVAVGAGEGTVVGVGVGASVGLADGAGVGDVVGALVGAFVGAFVGAGVGNFVGAFVGNCVPEPTLATTSVSACTFTMCPDAANAASRFDMKVAKSSSIAIADANAERVANVSVISRSASEAAMSLLDPAISTCWTRLNSEAKHDSSEASKAVVVVRKVSLNEAVPAGAVGAFVGAFVGALVGAIEAEQ